MTAVLITVTCLPFSSRWERRWGFPALPSNLWRVPTYQRGCKRGPCYSGLKTNSLLRIRDKQSSGTCQLAYVNPLESTGKLTKGGCGWKQVSSVCTDVLQILTFIHPPPEIPAFLEVLDFYLPPKCSLLWAPLMRMLQNTDVIGNEGKF